MAEPEIPVYQKDPNATIDYDIDLSPVVSGRSGYLEDGETLQSASWEVEEGPENEQGDFQLAIALSPPPSFTTTRMKVWLTDGTPGQFYRVRARFTTSLNRVDDRSIWIEVKHL